MLRAATVLHVPISGSWFPHSVGIGARGVPVQRYWQRAAPHTAALAGAAVSMALPALLQRACALQCLPRCRSPLCRWRRWMPPTARCCFVGCRLLGMPAGAGLRSPQQAVSPAACPVCAPTDSSLGSLWVRALVARVCLRPVEQCPAQACCCEAAQSLYLCTLWLSLCARQPIPGQSCWWEMLLLRAAVRLRLAALSLGVCVIAQPESIAAWPWLPAAG